MKWDIMQRHRLSFSGVLAPRQELLLRIGWPGIPDPLASCCAYLKFMKTHHLHSTFHYLPDNSATGGGK